MLSKTKKIALLTTGLVGALVTSSAVGVALSSCTTNSTSTEVEENTKYNTYINWSDPSTLSNLVVDESGLVYSDIYKTTVIAVTPSFTGTTITIPASVTSITGYTEVLPSGTTIVRGAFQPTATTGSGTTAQSGVTLNNLISTVKFAANSKLKSIGAQAFSGCTLLQSIDLPTTVTMIGNSAFSGCTLLGAINLTNVEYVGNSAFANLATSLINPTISISLNKAVVIGNNAFQNASITSVDFSANTTLISMGNSAFNGCSSLAGTIDLSKATTLTNTGTNTFQNCSSITAVNLPSSLRTIGVYAFSGCTSIANTIDLSGATKLSTIGNYAFQNCTNLTGLSYPVSAPITLFGTSAFSGCSALTQLGTVAGAFTAPAALTSIASSAFAGTKISVVDISNMTATSPFQNSALAGMTSLTEVKFNTTITTLPQTLFNGDTALKTIKLPSSITSINVGTSGSSNTSTFYGSSLETIDMSEITSYSTNEGSTTTVPAYLFSGLTSLSSVILKTGTTAIDQNAFQGTSGLTSVREADQSSTEIGFTTTGTLTRIGNNAFEGTGLTSFTLSAITSSSEGENTANPTFNLGNEVFQGATKLETVDLSNANLLNNEGNSIIIPTFAFGNATALKTVKLPVPSNNNNISSLTIKEGSFSGVTSLSSIDFSGFTSLEIDVNNFTSASSLESIDLSNLTIIPEFISTNNEQAVFTGLSDNAVVKLSSVINKINNSAVFTKTRAEDATSYTRVALEYPNGIAFAADQVDSGTLSGISSLLSAVSGALDLSSNSNLTSLGTDTLFGNANIISLTMPASNIQSDTSLYMLGSSVNAITPSENSARTNDQYTLDNVPLGNNIALKNINFDKFSLNETIVGVGGLKAETFTAIAKIMNSYAYYSGSTSYSARATTDSVNFKEWQSGDSNTWIEQDANLTYVPNADNINGVLTLQNVAVSDNVSNATTKTDQTITFTTGTNLSKKLTHNNIIWNLVYNANAKTITLTTDATTPANIYRGKTSGDSSKELQVYLKTIDNDGNTLDKTGVQITMSIKLV